MGLYAYIGEHELPRLTKVSDLQVNEVFQNALKLCPSLLIAERDVIKKKGWFQSTPTMETFYAVYHKEHYRGTWTGQARQMLCASGKKEIAMAYLYGIINGVEDKKLNDY